ncbi:hypothetical protein [Catellatospora tritici]|uniref:hypothetical protein n=1 Tax=Catellatospora tritici TaxID=2851566 RepID=UPI001C2DB369|nr:hypothetical protein [Catellatospora tritici]MBV1856651.1 hypothetical protein [Catellatospora tritici]
MSEQNIADAQIVVKSDMGRNHELEFDYDIVVVAGERGRQLAAAQAESILEILEPFGPPAEPSDRPGPEPDETSSRAELM